MSEWKNVPLHTVVNIRISNVDKKNAPNEDAVLLCNYMDVYSNDYIKAGLPFMEATANRSEISRFKVELGDVLITKDSETPFDIGIPSVVVEDIKNLVCGYHLALFKPDKSTIDSVYLAKQLATSDAASYFSRMASGSTRYGLSNKTIADFNVPLAPLREQQKIAHILTTVDNLIEKTQALIDKYTAVKQGMMHDLFTRGIDIATGQLRPSYEQAPELYKETELGWVPREWGVVPLRLVVDKIADRDHFTPIYYDEGIPIISPKDFGELDKISFEKCKYISIDAHDKNRKKTDLGVNDIVFTRIGAGLGKAAIVTPDMPEFSILHSAAMIRLNRKVMEPMYLLYLLKSFVIQRQIGVEVQSIGVPDLGLEKINEFMVLCPNKNEQIKAAGSIEAIDVSIEGEYKQLKAFQLLKKGLMQDLLTGRVRVKQEAEHVN